MTGGRPSVYRNDCSHQRICCFFVTTVTPVEAQQKVWLNWGAIRGVMTGIWVAQEEGLFKKHGLDFELIHIASTFKAINSMLSGEIHDTTADALNSIQPVANVRFVAEVEQEGFLKKLN